MEVKNMSFFSAEPTVDVAGKVLDEFNNVEGLKEVVDGILSLQENEIYEKLVHMDNPIDSSVDKRYGAKNNEYSDLELLAAKHLSKFPLSIPLAPLIGIKHFWVIYTFIGDLYSIRTAHKIYQEDLYGVENGTMATRIVLLLENFDSNQKTPKPTEEFFKRLGKVKWQDKKAKKLFNGLRELFFMLVFNKWKGADGKAITFRATEKAFILLLSGCSAVLEGRDKINTFDVIRANKTYLKLIDTDISKLM
ncbi:MAG: hypothetical protein H5T96_09170 [Tissierellales bacterium]|nr:hypothetical protein [Tissierellales bacterium]